MRKVYRMMTFTAMTMIAFMALKVNASGSFTTEEFIFESSGLKLNGIISQPKNVDAKSIVIIVHSYGATDVVKGNWFYDLRSMFTARGIAVAVWDKPGCGNSEGKFNIQQPVDSSADEVVDAIRFLRANRIPGYQQIGMMGGSRAGWIAPLAISKVADVNFWISISGTDAYESWGYLLRSTLEIAGHTEADIETLYQEWLDSIQVIMRRGSYSEYLNATSTLRKNKVYQELTGQKYTQYQKSSVEFAKEKEHFDKIQREYLSESYEYDKKSGLKIYVQNFEQILSQISIPVLAIFGDNDRHVDWRKTKKLYEQTMGKNKDSLLNIKVFKGADHVLKMSKTGGYFEVGKPGYWDLPYAEGYHQSMIDFLCFNKFCAESNSH